MFSYLRHFDVADKDDKAESARLFSIPDFVGDACKAIASRVRGAVAGVPFDEFHKVSAFTAFSFLYLLQSCSRISF